MLLTIHDRNILESYKILTKGISNLFGTGCEVLVHSLENYDNSVIAIENGHNSGRNVGAPITDLALELINSSNNGKQFLSPYQSKFSSGERCYSVTMPIKNADKLIGLFCINFNIDISFADFIKNFAIASNENNQDGVEMYSSSIDEMMNSILTKNISNVMLDNTIPNQDKNRVIISKLHKIGFFNLKGSVEALADKLQISIHTVYSNIRKAPDKD